MRLLYFVDIIPTGVFGAGLKSAHTKTLVDWLASGFVSSGWCTPACPVCGWSGSLFIVVSDVDG